MNFNKSKRDPAITWKRITCQWITSKKYSTLMGRHLSPRHGQVILVSGYIFWQLSIDDNNEVQSASS